MPERVRGGVILVRDGALAVIERRRVGVGTYYVLPGGGCEPGESPQDAAIREGFEELGLHLELRGLVATVAFNGNLQHYFTAAVTGGHFGGGTGPEMQDPLESPGGSHRAVWLGLAGLGGYDVRPVAIRDLLAGEAAAAGSRLAALVASPLHVHE